MMMEKLRTLFRTNHLQSLQVEADDLIFLGYLGTLLQFGIPRTDVYVDVFLFSDQRISVSSLVWILFINLYLAILIYVHYRNTNDREYLWVSRLYLFALVEIFLLYDHPLFRIPLFTVFSLKMYIPVYSDTAIFFCFAHLYYRKNFVRWGL